MGFEDTVKHSFKRAKEDTEGIKNELAFALKRIAKIEEILNKQAIEGISVTYPSERVERVITYKTPKKARKKVKKITWRQQIKKTMKKYPNKNLKQQLKIASKSYRKKR